FGMCAIPILPTRSLSLLMQEALKKDRSRAELLAERRGRRRPGPAGVLPLRLGGQAELPAFRQVARPACHLGELPAERLRLGEVDVADRVVVSLGKLRGRLARKLP